MSRHFKAARILLAFACLLACALVGCAGDPEKYPGDPHHDFNKSMDDFNAGADAILLKPPTDLYVAITPKIARDLLHNAYGNVSYFDTVANGLMQGKFEQGGQDALRMLINSTIGIGGFLDVAAPMGLPKHNEDFGLTLAAWGVPQADYLVLPFVGPTSARDFWGVPFTVLANPLTWIGMPPAASWPVTGFGLIDYRAAAENEVRFRDRTALDPYSFTRDAFLRNREFRVRGAAGTPSTRPALDYFENEDEDAPATAPATQPATRPAR